MGEGLDGNPLTYKDFMNPKDNTVPKRAYAIYAGSRQGKGILTNTLLVHALSSGAKLAYIDGKPDTGISIGSLAWKKHKEAFNSITEKYIDYFDLVVYAIPTKVKYIGGAKDTDPNYKAFFDELFPEETLSK